MKFFLSFLFVGILFVPFAVRADVINDGYHSVSTCFVLDNSAEYPDYTFLLITEDILMGVRVVQQDSCAGFYKLSTGRFAVIPTTTFTELLGERFIILSDGGIFDTSTDAGAETWAQDYADYLVFSDVKLKLETSAVPDQNPLDDMYYHYHIDALSDDALTVSLAGVTYVYQDGSDTYVPADANGIVPESSQVFSRSSLFMILPFTGLFLLIFSWVKTRKK